MTALHRAAWAAVVLVAGLAALLLWPARVARLRWGEDIVFTHGPTGYVYTGIDHPETFAEVVGGWAALAIVATVAGARLAHARGLRPAAALAWLLVLLAVASLRREPQIGVVPLLLLATHAAGLPPTADGAFWSAAMFR